MKKEFIVIFFTVLFFSGTVSAVDQDFFAKDKKSPFYVSPVVSVIISGTDQRHMSEVLSHAVRLSRKVPVRNVLVFHKGQGIERLSHLPEMESESTEMLEKLQIKLPENPYRAYFQELGLYSTGLKSPETILKRLKISYSPTWVVRYEGKDYIYEGYTEINRFFSNDGSFLPQ